MITRNVFAAVMLITALTFAGSAYAADAGNGWKTEIAPYVWFAGVSGDFTVKGQSAHVNESFNDLKDYIDFGGMLHVESGRGRVAVLLDTAYIKLSDSRTLVKLDQKESITELGAVFKLFGPESGPGLALDVLAGGRYLYVENEINLFGTVGRADRQDWIDPFAGGRVRWGLTKNLLLVLRADVGGFNVNSKSSWNAAGTLAYTFTDSFAAGAGYRAFYDHYETGGFSDKFEYNATMKGPFVGVAFRF